MAAADGAGAGMAAVDGAAAGVAAGMAAGAAPGGMAAGGGWGWGGCGWGWGGCGGWWGPAFATGVALGAVGSYPYWGGDYGYGYGTEATIRLRTAAGLRPIYSRSDRYLGRRWVNVCQ